MVLGPVFTRGIGVATVPPLYQFVLPTPVMAAFTTATSLPLMTPEPSLSFAIVRLNGIVAPVTGAG